MNYKETTTTTIAHSADLEALRAKLEEDGEVYYDNQNSEEAHEQLLQTLLTNDCREVITATVDGVDLANAFVEAGNRNHVDLIEAFLNHGMNVNIKDINGFTALMSASWNRQEESVRFLLDRYATVYAQDNIGHTALMYASVNGFTEIVEMLLTKNANPDIQDKGGKTALMWASLRSHKEIVEVLLNHNADIELKSVVGKTALALAKTEEIKEMIRNHVTASYVLK